MKQWDLVVYCDGVPIVVIELKSQNGPSCGNNANNRAEEAIGSAVDFAAARDDGLFPGDPWLGYVFVVEDDLDSRAKVRDSQKSPFLMHSGFERWAYVQRVATLGQRLIDRDHYCAAWIVATSRPDCPQTKERKCPQLKRELSSHEHSFDWMESDPDSLG